ncbi:hypothetical protein [Paraburkholderia rhynchosiae]|uniref:HPt domain-containing protein n=1 Tax=Paraburkholderia rhynchosiae TaxID=487049 RepID=A0A6J5BD39_9BURK|nr:hypothetical protein [Paraburkholderia rhynchosiae]CAB3701020.1 hypothetical protein LMG27174_03668 [Paraburkholderia rhynchosiae]
MKKTSLHDRKNAGLGQRGQDADKVEHQRSTQVSAHAAGESAQPADGDVQPCDSRDASRHATRNFSASFEPSEPLPPFEPFERRYLDALAEEGIDLDAFLDGWCRAMHDDLGRLCDLRRKGELARLPGLLHRLSGAVGLVGAQSLMEALRHASLLLPEHNAASIDALTARTRTLIAQLEARRDAHRGGRP